jgi:hypothetical protein
MFFCSEVLKFFFSLSGTRRRRRRIARKLRIFVFFCLIVLRFFLDGEVGGGRGEYIK